MPEPRSGSTTKPRVAERPLGNGKPLKSTLKGSHKPLESGQWSVTCTPFLPGRKLSRNRWDSSFHRHPFLQNSPHVCNNDRPIFPRSRQRTLDKDRGTIRPSIPWFGRTEYSSYSCDCPRPFLLPFLEDPEPRNKSRGTTKSQPAGALALVKLHKSTGSLTPRSFKYSSTSRSISKVDKSNPGPSTKRKNTCRIANGNCLSDSCTLCK